MQEPKPTNTRETSVTVACAGKKFDVVLFQNGGLLGVYDADGVPVDIGNTEAEIIHVLATSHQMLGAQLADALKLQQTTQSRKARSKRRALFAAHAIQGMIGHDPYKNLPSKQLASFARELADEMLAELEK